MKDHISNLQDCTPQELFLIVQKNYMDGARVTLPRSTFHFRPPCQCSFNCFLLVDRRKQYTTVRAPSMHYSLRYDSFILRQVAGLPGCRHARAPHHECRENETDP